MTGIDLTLIQPVLKRYTGHQRTHLIPLLYDIQEVYGYIPEGAAELAAATLKVPLADVHGVIEFYALLYNKPVSRTVIHICGDPACALAGSNSLFKRATRKNAGGKSTDADTLTVERAPCLGLCEHAPIALVSGRPILKAHLETWEDLITGKGKRPDTAVGGDVALLTKNCGKGKTTDYHNYVMSGGYRALQSMISKTPVEVIAMVKDAGLVGRGGAAFPTGIKWEGASKTPGDEKFVICNADEAEPGTFKDRVLMEDDPHSILEGMIIAAYAIGAKKGYFYIRGEYEMAYIAVKNAIREAHENHLLGENILDQEFSFNIEIRRGAGAYICGEETALFESIEGKRGYPRMKPPFPTVVGLFGKPTVINNVETLANIPIIVNLGAEQYRQHGTEKSTGTKLFCVSGDVTVPGLYEVPFGVTLRHVIENLAGGVRQGNRFKAAILGGAAGTFASKDDLDVRLSFEDLRAANLSLGSGVITVLDETRDIKETLKLIAHFFDEESCGKCYPCQIGTRRQKEILDRISAGWTRPGDMERLLKIGTTMTETSLCGLGQTAASAVTSAIHKWPELFTAVRQPAGKARR